MNELQQLAQERLDQGGRGRGILFEGQWHGWERVYETARKVVELVEASGVPSRESVLFIAGNSPASLAALLGLVAAGRTIRFVYAFQSGKAIAESVSRLKPGVVLAAEQDVSEEVRTAISQHGAAAITLSVNDAAALAGFVRSTAEPEPDAPAEPTLDIQTSGTTGPAKRFPVTYDQALHHFVRHAVATAIGGEEEDSPPALLTMTMGNLAGMMGTLPSLIRGSEIILYDKFNLAGWLDYVRAYRPERSGLQPAAVQMLLDSDVPREDLAGMISLTVGSAPLRPEQRRAFEERYGIPVLLAYGATEFFGTAASMSLEMLAEWGDTKEGSVGPAVPGFELRIVDPEGGATLAPGEEGLLEVRNAAIGPDWIHTSDLAVVDADGFLYLRGRADGAIIRGGFKLLPETIEQGLMEHKAVALAAVVGVSDHRLGQVPAAAIQLKSGHAKPGFDALEAHLRQHVPATHIPVHWRFVEDFARTPSLKIDRGALARLFAGGAD
ncbi:MAG: fatty acid--CoA ligase family protein [Novosphingobium sp.]|nr:fatty acid--CoA ligase family protein [Novosphingobium sp.]